MTHLAEISFWIGAIWIGYVYIGYPTLLGLVTVFWRYRTRSSDDYLPTVSVLLAARNEQRDIGWKVAETLGWDYPKEKLELLVASDASNDKTDEILGDVTDPRFRYLRLEPRQGKAVALNRLYELARGELLFFSDANSHIEPQCLRTMVRHFADDNVGCVTGSERTVTEQEEHSMSASTSAFLGYESLVNALESRLGSVLVCDGSIFCIRRSLFSMLRPDLANDLELPLLIGGQGRAILFDSSAISWERATSSAGEEFRRKRRICAQGVLGFWWLRQHLGGFRGWQFFSRKILRWMGAIPLMLILLTSSLLVSKPFYRYAVGFEIVFYGLALTGAFFAAKGRVGNRATAFPFYFVMVNVAALMGIAAGISGKKFSVWESPAQSRGAATNSSVGATHAEKT